MAITLVTRNDEHFGNWDAIDNAKAGMTFYEKDDDFLVYYNSKTATYAVYYKLWNDGELIGLITRYPDANDFEAVMGMSWSTCDHLFNDRVFDLFREHAMEYGFPERHPEIKPKGTTWRMLRDAIDKMDERFLDETARVWIPGDMDLGKCDAFVPLTAHITPFDGDEEPSDENFYSVNLDEDLYYSE